MHSRTNPEDDFNDHCEINLGKLQHDFSLRLNVNIQLISKSVNLHQGKGDGGKLFF